MSKPLQQTVANTILIINISNSNNLNKFWVGIFTHQGPVNQVYQKGVTELVSMWVSQLVTSIANAMVGLGSDKIKQIWLQFQEALWYVDQSRANMFAFFIPAAA